MPRASRSVYLDHKAQRDVIHRLSRVIGQVQGLKRALEGRKTCEDLLIQASAIRSAMGQVMARLLENHMQTCVIDDLRRGSAPKAVARLRNALAVVLRRT